MEGGEEGEEKTWGAGVERKNAGMCCECVC